MNSCLSWQCRSEEVVACQLRDRMDSKLFHISRQYWRKVNCDG